MHQRLASGLSTAREGFEQGFQAVLGTKSMQKVNSKIRIWTTVFDYITKLFPPLSVYVMSIFDSFQIKDLSGVPDGETQIIVRYW